MYVIKTFPYNVCTVRVDSSKEHDSFFCKNSRKNEKKIHLAPRRPFYHCFDYGTLLTKSFWTCKYILCTCYHSCFYSSLKDKAFLAMVRAPTLELAPPINPPAWTKIHPSIPLTLSKSLSRIPRQGAGNDFLL